LHVGNIRTALFDWAYARHTGGQFIFRIEDTDRERVTDEYIKAAQDTLKWLGLNWDEGPEVGGPYGPYLQSQRLDIYAEWAAKFLAQGDAYHCYCSSEELEARREAQKAANVAPGYDGKCRTISADDLAKYKSEGRLPVLRMRMPDGSTTFTDSIRGDVTFDHNFVPDFVLVRGDGSPLYTLAVAVDDILMKVTHVLRGEDLLSSTPRQIRVYQAMGVSESDYPTFAHLPFVMGQDNAKLSKRNGDKIRELTLDELLKRTTPFLIKDGVITGTAEELEVVKSALPIIQERIATLAEVSQMLKFLFVSKFEVDAEELPKIKDEQAQAVLKKSNEVLQKLENWDHESIHVALKSALIEELGLKPRVAFGAVRIAVTGSHISPPLFESMELLGRTRSLERIAGSIS